MLKRIALISLLLAPSFLYAATSQVTQFSQSLFKELGIQPHRINSTAGNISIKFKKLNGDAAATYHPWFNRITFHTDLKNGRNLKTIPMLKAKEPITYSVQLSTIFHEFGHAELDTVVENIRTHEDDVMLQTFRNEIKPWFKRNFRVNTQTAVHELYGYYRGEVIEYLYNEIHKILINNGVNMYAKRCFKAKSLQAKALEIPRDEFNKLIMMDSPNFNLKLRDKIQTKWIFIGGKSIDISSAKKDKFNPRWYHVMWDQIWASHRQPATTEEVLNHLNKHNTEIINLLNKCRPAMWDEINNKTQTM